jgi:hypothetical protein
MVNVYVAKTAATREAVEWAKVILAALSMPPTATVYSDSRSALQALARPAR